MVTDRLASMANTLAFIKGGAGLASGSESFNAISLILDAASKAIENYCLPSSAFNWLQQTWTETFGVDHYGRGMRNQIRLSVTPVNSITSVTDNLPIGGNLLDSSEYVVNPKSGILWRIHGKFYCGPEAVQVVYNAGYAPTGAGDTYCLAVPADLAMGCMEQVAYEFSLRQPGGSFYGVSSLSRPDGSMVSSVTNNLLPSVKAKLSQYITKEFH